MLQKVLEQPMLLVMGMLLASSLMFPSAHAADEGKLLAWKYHCVTCHGDNGMSNDARYPHLAGQNTAYIVSRLKYFRAQEEPGNQMNAQAVLLDDETIDLLAEYFNKQVR